MEALQLKFPWKLVSNKNKLAYTNKRRARILHYEPDRPSVYKSQSWNSLFNFPLAGEETGHHTESHINYLDKSNSSPLHLAVRGGNMDAIRLCLANGAKVDQQQVLAPHSASCCDKRFNIWERLIADIAVHHPSVCLLHASSGLLYFILF